MLELFVLDGPLAGVLATDGRRTADLNVIEPNNTGVSDVALKSAGGDVEGKVGTLVAVKDSSSSDTELECAGD